MTKQYELTYDDGDVPTHYGWKQNSRLDPLQREYEETKSGAWRPAAKKPAKSLAKEARATLAKLDSEGRWVSGDATSPPRFADVSVYLSSEVFSRNLEELATFVVAAGAAGE